MGLTDSIRAYDQKPCARVVINGSEFYGWLEIRREVSFDQGIANAYIRTYNNLPVDPGMVYLTEIYEGYDGFMARVFTGYIDVRASYRPEHERELVCRDVLKRAAETWLDDTGQSFSSTQAESAVVTLLALAGITNVQAATSNFTIGDIHPAEFKLCSILDACNQIAGLIGWSLWASSDGTVIFRHRKPLPGTNSVWTYREASSPSATDGNIIGEFRHGKNDISLRNRAVVIGYEDIREEYSESSRYVPSPPTHRTMILSSELIDTDGMARSFARWLVRDCNHLWEDGTLKIPGNPLLQMGQTIKIIESTVSGISSNFFVFAQSSQIGRGSGYTMNLTVCGGDSSPRDNEGGGEDLAPIASFEVMQIAWGDPTYVVYVDGSASYSPDSTITDYTWTWGDGDPDTSGASPKAIHKYDAPGVVTITLTITCANGKTGTCSKDVDVGNEADASFIKRILYAGGNSYLWVSADSGNAWTNTAVDSPVLCISAYMFDPDGAVIFGCESGALYLAEEMGTAFTSITLFDDAVTSVYIDQTDDTHWIVGTAGGELWETLDSGDNWTLKATFDGAICRIAFCNPTDLNEWYAAGDTFLQHSFDGGNTFSDLLTNFSNGTMTGVNYFAWHFLGDIGVATVGGTVPVGYSPDGGTTFSGSVGLTGTPTAITGGILQPGEFAVALESDVVYTALDGINYSSGGAWYDIAPDTFPGAQDLRYDSVAWSTLFAGG